MRGRERGDEQRGTEGERLRVRGGMERENSRDETQEEAERKTGHERIRERESGFFFTRVAKANPEEQRI